MSAAQRISRIENDLSALRAMWSLPPVAVKSMPPASTEKPAVSTEKPKSKRVLSESMLRLRGERAAVFEELKEAWALANPDFASLDAAALKAAVKNGEVEAKPLFSDALQEHGRRSRADDPEKQAKYDAYRAKVEADPRRKKGNASVSSASSAPKPEPVADVKKRKPQSEETKAAAKIKRAATKAATKAATEAAKLLESASVAVVAPNPFDDADLPAAALPAAPAGAEVVEASADDVEAFAPFDFKGAKYWKNGLHWVYKRTSDKGFGAWVGFWDSAKKVIGNEEEPPVE